MLMDNCAQLLLKLFTGRMDYQIMNGKDKAVHHVIDTPLKIVDFSSFQIIKYLNDSLLALMAVKDLEQFIEQLGIIGDRVIHMHPDLICFSLPLSTTQR